MLRKVWNIITWVLVALIAIIAFLLFGFRLFGFQIYTVLSGSMEPTYLTGSVVYVKSVDTNELKVGDVITYKVSSNTLVTHRIVDIVNDTSNPSHKLFKTKGDNNNTVDETPVSEKNVKGKVVFSIPLLGYIASFLQSSSGKFAFIGIGFVLIALIFLPDLFFPKDKDKKTSE